MNSAIVTNVVNEKLLILIIVIVNRTTHYHAILQWCTYANAVDVILYCTCLSLVYEVDRRVEIAQWCVSVRSMPPFKLVGLECTHFTLMLLTCMLEG